MFTCDLKTKIYENQPLWTSGCQSEPDDYVCKLISERNEKLNITQIKDRTLTIFFEVIMKNPRVESVQIETRSVYHNWPDEWGSKRTDKQLAWEKAGCNHKNLSEVKIKFVNRHSDPIYIKDGVPISHIDNDDLSEIKRHIVDDLSLNILIFERIKS